MLVRICDKAVSPRGKVTIKNIRVVECSKIFDNLHMVRSLVECELQNVLLYIDPKTKKATVVEMWLENMREVK